LIEALEDRIENKITEAQVISWAVNPIKVSKSNLKPTEVPIMAKGNIVGKILRSDRVVTISLNDQERMEDLLGFLEKWVDKLR
jgi:hypothetical protein